MGDLFLILWLFAGLALAFRVGLSYQRIRVLDVLIRETEIQNAELAGEAGPFDPRVALRRLEDALDEALR